MNSSPHPPDPSEQTIFDAAQQIPDPQARSAYLDAACAGNAALRERIGRLLRAGERADEFLAQNPLGALAQSDTARETGQGVEGPGTIIGNYKLLEKIGEGGFGDVYMAEQRQPIKRRVALKIIKIGMDTREVVARFEAERQALAVMDHPNIAKVFDAGATEAPVAAGILPAVEPGFQPGGMHGDERRDVALSSVVPGGRMPPSTAGKMPAATLSAGRPYFVMELVRGTRITDYCDERNLSARERLDLFTQVCQAVQHAHQKGIIHRDLKPSNILVTINDGVAVPKIIDFGIAKATQMELSEKTVFTRFQQFLGTPAYMSPEQAELTSLDIDTRSDIYSLGVLLYELLTGKTPFDAKELLKAGLDEMRRTIREKEPERPSTRVSTLNGEEQTTTARRRGLEPPKLFNLLRGDLDWIVMKCLEKDRARRYETANGLASDIQRHLNNEPVVACPPSNFYRFQKLVRRNKLTCIAGTGITAALVIGLAIALWQYIEKTRAYEQARTEAAKSQQVAQFLQDMLKGVGPSKARGRDTEMLREILDQTTDRIGKELTNQPAVEIDLRITIASVYRELGLYEKAEMVLRRAVEIRRKMEPDGSPALANALDDLAVGLDRLGKLTEAEELLRTAIAMHRNPAEKAESLCYLGNVLLHAGRPAEAEKSLRDALTTLRENYGQQAPNVTSIRAELAKVLMNQGKLAEAEKIYREVVTLIKQGDESPRVAVFLGGLGRVLQEAGKLEEAETTMRQVLAINRKLLSGDHPQIATTLNNLAGVLKDQGRLAEAEAMYREALAIKRTVFGNENSETAATLNNLAGVFMLQNKLVEAEAMYREALAIARKSWGNEHPHIARTLVNLGRVLAKRGQLQQAEALMVEALEMSRKLLGNEHPDVAVHLGFLADVLLIEGKFQQAEPLARESVEFRQKHDPESWWAFSDRALLGASLLGQKRYADAEPLLLSGFDGLKQREHRIPAAYRRWLKEATQRLVQLYEETSRPERAAEWKQKLAEFEKAEVKQKADAP